MSDRIKELEQEIKKDTTALKAKKALLTKLKAEQSNNIDIQWADEVKHFLNYGKANLIGMSVDVIAGAISLKKRIIVDRNVKNKVVSALSRLYRKEIVCKGEYNGLLYYGYCELFEKDKRTLRKAVIDSMNKDDDDSWI